MAENNDPKDQGWVITDCLEIPGMPHLFWKSLQVFGYTDPPTYVGKEYEEHGNLSCIIHVVIPANTSVTPEWESWTVSVDGSELHPTWDVAAFKALTRFCEDRKDEVAGTTLALLPIHDVSDFEWRRRIDFVFDSSHPHYMPPLATVEYYSLALFPICNNQRMELNIYRNALRQSEERNQAKDVEISALKQQLQEKDEQMADIIEERDQAQDDAELFESQMLEAQDDLDAFKAAHLPRLEDGLVIDLEHGEQVDEEMDNLENEDVEMEELEEEEDPEMVEEEIDE